MSEIDIDRPSDATACSVEEWWARHAALLAQKMALSNVRSFKIEQMPNGRYAFEVAPEEGIPIREYHQDQQQYQEQPGPPNASDVPCADARPLDHD